MPLSSKPYLRSEPAFQKTKTLERSHKNRQRHSLLKTLHKRNKTWPGWSSFMQVTSLKTSLKILSAKNAEHWQHKDALVARWPGIAHVIVNSVSGKNIRPSVVCFKKLRKKKKLQMEELKLPQEVPRKAKERKGPLFKSCEAFNKNKFAEKFKIKFTSTFKQPKLFLPAGVLGFWGFGV